MRPEQDDSLTAEMREDIDGLENENLKNTVIVRKLATKESVPKDKKALRNFIQSKARELVMKIVNKIVTVIDSVPDLINHWVGRVKNQSGVVLQLQVTHNMQRGIEVSFSWVC